MNIKLIDFLKAIIESKIDVNNIKDVYIVDGCNEFYTDSVTVRINNKTIELVLPLTTRGEHDWLNQPEAE